MEKKLKTLAFDTSGEALVVALAENKKIIAEYKDAGDSMSRLYTSSSKNRPKHSALLIPAIEKILRKAKCSPGQLSVLAVGVGPGSFTGIRVGVTTAKILGKVWNKKIVPVSSLECFARQLTNKRSGKTTVVMDARKGKVYAAIFDTTDGKIRVYKKPFLESREKLAGKNGIVYDEFGPDCAHSPVIQVTALVEAAFEKALNKEFVTAEKLEPLYLHPRDCNVTIGKRQK